MAAKPDNGPDPARGDPIRLTARCKAGGCAGKLGPADLKGALAQFDPGSHPDLLVRIATGDDAGVYRLSDGLAIVNTVDFFTPILDDPFTYGQIAAANALSDVYAMGGRPSTALNILGIPADSVPPRIMNLILRGGAAKIKEAKCVLIGGHTIRNPEPIY